VRPLYIFFLVVVGTVIVDLGIKDIFVLGYEWQSNCISLELHYNRGVAFSMFSSLGIYLKWIQMLLITGMVIYIFISGFIKKYALALGLIIGGAIGNLYDRFAHDAVVDYIYWHCWFNYPVFNYADIMVVVGVTWIAITKLFEK